MIYIFDSSPLIHLFKSYYKKRFPSLWEKFDDMVDNGRIISVEMVYDEVDLKNSNDTLKEWATKNKTTFFHRTSVKIIK